MKLSVAKIDNFWTPLHGLRGIAVMFVVASHMGNAGMPLLPFPHNAVGKVGVWIFFGLSAFLLTNRLQAALRRSASVGRTLASYFVSRVFRIYPLFLLVLLINYYKGWIDGAGLLHHVLLTEGREELWAIPVEFRYYFVIPVLVLVDRFLSSRWALVLSGLATALSLYVMVANPAAIYSNEIALLPKAMPLLLGSMLALTWSPAQLGSAWRPSMAALVSLVLLISMALLTWWFREVQMKSLPVEMAAWNSLLLSLTVTGLIAFSFVGSPLRRLLQNRVLVWLGEISFSMYLLHMFVVGKIINMQAVPAIAKGSLALGAVLLCAYLSYRLVEQKGIAIGKLLNERLRLSRPAAEAPTTSTVRRAAR
jgi:peptidoglycan/LPS O-acetylase OafA/YrhL